MNGYPSFYPRIALVAPSPGLQADCVDGRKKVDKSLAILLWKIRISFSFYQEFTHRGLAAFKMAFSVSITSLSIP